MDVTATRTTKESADTLVMSNISITVDILIQLYTLV